MKQGRTPQQACEDALAMIVEKYKNVNPEFFPSEKFIAISKNGDWGCAAMQGRREPGMSVQNTAGYKVGRGTVFSNL